MDGRAETIFNSFPDASSRELSDALIEGEQHLSILKQKFARKAAVNVKYKNWFKENVRQNRNSKKYVLPKARTSIFQKYPLFYLNKLLNETEDKNG